MSDVASTLLEECPVSLSRLTSQASNEVLMQCDRGDLARIGSFLDARGGRLETMTGLDLTEMGQEYAVEYVYSLPACRRVSQDPRRRSSGRPGVPIPDASDPRGAVV